MGQQGPVGGIDHRSPTAQVRSGQSCEPEMAKRHGAEIIETQWTRGPLHADGLHSDKGAIPASGTNDNIVATGLGHNHRTVRPGLIRWGSGQGAIDTPGTYNRRGGERPGQDLRIDDERACLGLEDDGRCRKCRHIEGLRYHEFRTQNRLHL